MILSIMRGIGRKINKRGKVERKINKREGVERKEKKR